MLDSGTRIRWVDRATLWPHYPTEKRHAVRCTERWVSLVATRDFEPRALQQVASRYTVCATAAVRVYGSLCKEVPRCTVNHTHAQQVRICRHNTDNVCTDTHS